MQDLEKATLEDVQEFFRTYYTPNNCVLTIAGEFDNAEARKLIEEYFGSLPPGPPLKRQRRREITLPTAPRITVCDRVPRIGSRLARRRLFRERRCPARPPHDAPRRRQDSWLYKRLVYDEQVASDVSAFNYSLGSRGS
jgi:zinc protease